MNGCNEYCSSVERERERDVDSSGSNSLSLDHIIPGRKRQIQQEFCNGMEGRQTGLSLT
jgi:hypothetical protein